MQTTFRICILILPVLVILFPQPLAAQKYMVLQSLKNSTRTKKIPLDRRYEITTADTTVFSDIYGLTDSGIKIVVNSINYDTLVARPIWNNGKVVRDSMIHPYRQDTVALAAKDILYLRKPSFKNRRWLAPFILEAVCGAAGFLFLPIVLIKNDRQDLIDFAVFEGFIVGTSGTALLIGLHTRRFDMRKKWKISGSTDH